MQLLMDTRERNPLTFEFVSGVSVKSECLKVGDYAARHDNGEMDLSVVERKSVADLFHSFTHEYENEKKKIERAKDMGLHYILAVESTALGILKGCDYKKGGKLHKVKKDGLSQYRQIITIQRKYGVEVWWCNSRSEMAFMIQEYFLAHQRISENSKNENPKRLPKNDTK